MQLDEFQDRVRVSARLVARGDHRRRHYRPMLAVSCSPCHAIAIHAARALSVRRRSRGNCGPATVLSFTLVKGIVQNYTTN